MHNAHGDCECISRVLHMYCVRCREIREIHVLRCIARCIVGVLRENTDVGWHRREYMCISCVLRCILMCIAARENTCRIHVEYI